MNSYFQGSQAGGYTVQPGDTLQGIAANLWGDGSLWYKLAEVNGLSANSPLTEGTSLIVPAGVIRNTNSATTFKPYDPADILGNVNPTTAPKPKKNKCGGFGQLLTVVIAIVVTAWTAGALTGALGAMATGVNAGGVLAAAWTGGATALAGGTVLGSGLALTSAGSVVVGALGAAAGSIASQAFAVATGIQDKFSWNAVALAGISGGVGGAGNLGVQGKAWWSVGARAMVQSVASQGIGVMTGLQRKFSWTAVASAGVGAAAASGIGKMIPGGAKYDPETGKTLNPIWYHAAATGAAAAIADAATHSLINGSDFGDNILASLPSVLGNIVGQMLAGQVRMDEEKKDFQTASANSLGPTGRDAVGGMGGIAKALSELARGIAGLHLLDPSSIERLAQQTLAGTTPEEVADGMRPLPQSGSNGATTDDVSDVAEHTKYNGYENRELAAFGGIDPGTTKVGGTPMLSFLLGESPFALGRHSSEEVLGFFKANIGDMTNEEAFAWLNNGSFSEWQLRKGVQLFATQMSDDRMAYFANGLAQRYVSEGHLANWEAGRVAMKDNEAALVAYLGIVSAPFAVMAAPAVGSAYGSLSVNVGVRLGPKVTEALRFIGAGLAEMPLPAAGAGAGYAATRNVLDEVFERLNPSTASGAARGSVAPVVEKMKASGLGAAESGFSAAERGVIGEARTIVSSPEMAQLEAAHAAGEPLAVNVGGRLIQYEPGLPASGMTMFGENGFLMGREAFTSTLERNQTVLHELHRLTFSNSANGVSGALATQETQAAFDFAARASRHLP